MLSAKLKHRLAAALICSLLGGALGGWLGSGTPLKEIRSTAQTSDAVYVVDQTKRNTRFLKTDETGSLLGRILRPVQDGRNWRSYSDLMVDGDTIYVLERTADLASGLIQRETVLRCDFEAGRLDPVWELTVRDPSMDTNLAPQVHDGVLYFIQTDYNGLQAKANLYSMREGEKPEKETTVSYDIGVGFTDFYIGTDGTLAFTTPDGQVFSADETGKLTERLQSDRFQPILFFTGDGEHDIYVGQRNGQVLKADLTDVKPASPVFRWSDLDRSDYEAKAISFAPDGSFTAAFEAGTAAALVSEDGTQLFTHLKAPTGRIVLWSALGFVLVWLAAAVLAGLEKFFFFLTQGKVPVVTKLLSAFLPILICSLLLLNQLATGIFRQELEDGQYERLFLLTAQQTATMNENYIREITPETAYNSVHFYKLRADLNVLPAQGNIAYAEGEGNQQVYNSNYFWLYKPVDGTLVSLICEQDYLGVPVEARHRREVSEQFYRVMKTGQPVRTEFTDSLGDWTVLLTPVLDEENHVVAVMETGDSRLSMDYAVAQGVKQLNVLNLSILLVLAALLSAVIAVTLYPIGILKLRVDEISEGNLGVQAPVKGRDEIAEITRAFNTMSHNVESRDKEIRATSEGYSRFVPAKVFDLLEKSSVIDVRLADQTDVEAAVLNCSVGSFDQIARGLHSDEMFRMINRVLARLVPVINGTGGMVDRFEKAGLLAIYTAQTERALDAAVTLCQTLRNAAPEEAGGEPLDFHVTVSSGPAMIGIVGAEERLEAMTISEHTSFTGFLRPLAARYGASVLVTGSAAFQIPDFRERYHARTIGFVYMETLDRMERLYDVFDGDDDVTRQLKQETQEAFEKGVALYCSGKYYDARLLFIDVLKKNRRDLAAKQYLYLCDASYRGEIQKPEVYLETY